MRLSESESPACDDSSDRALAWKYFVAPDHADATMVGDVVTQLLGEGWRSTNEDRDGRVLARRQDGLRLWVQVTIYDDKTVSVGFSDGAHPY